MKKGLFVLLCAVLSLMLAFTGFGYASVSRLLELDTEFQVAGQTGVLIRQVSPAAGANAEIEFFHGTLLTSTLTLGSSPSSTLSYEITVYNNSNTVYAFDEVLYTVGEDTYSNRNIKFSLSGLKKNQQLAGHGSLTFTVTFSYASSTVTDTTLHSVLNFHFIEYIPGVADHFEVILNDTTLYQKLTDQMDNTGGWGGRPNDTYIGNVVGATSADSKVLNELFTVNGENMLKLPDISSNVTAMIKRENIDGNLATGDENGLEMTLYMTADTIGNADVTVYALVFTKHTADSAWEQIGEMYQGTAETNNYSYGNWGSPNSFNTDTWRASLPYYGVAAGSNASITAVITAYLNQTA